MSGLAPLAVLGALFVGVCLVALLSRLWSANGVQEPPVGPLRLAGPPQPAAPPVPAALGSLVARESQHWGYFESNWDTLLAQLDAVEEGLGGSVDPNRRDVPEAFSRPWLEARLSHLEKLAGPLPEPMRPTTLPGKRRRWWRRIGRFELPTTKKRTL